MLWFINYKLWLVNLQGKCTGQDSVSLRWLPWLRKCRRKVIITGKHDGHDTVSLAAMVRVMTTTTTTMAQKIRWQCFSYMQQTSHQHDNSHALMYCMLGLECTSKHFVKKIALNTQTSISIWKTLHNSNH